MILKFLLFTTITFFVSCYQNTGNDIYYEIKTFEFTRNADTSAFSKYITSGDHRIQSWVVESIGKIQNDSYIPLLSSLLPFENLDLRNKTIFALGQIGTDQCENILLDIYKDQEFLNSRKNIIDALGKCGKKNSALFLIKRFDSMNDSLKVNTIQNLAFIYKRIDPFEKLHQTITKYLSHGSDYLRQSAIYFFKRNTFPDSLQSIIKSNFPTNSLGNKYKLSAISSILQKQAPDSGAIEMLRTLLFSKPYEKKLNWREKIYKIKLMSIFTDSISIKKIAAYLNNQNPHIRLTAISSLGKIDGSYTKNLLLEYYNQADWAEKGSIILNLAKRYPKFIYKLIQQNLDQGSIHFKELLLQSLAKIGDDLSRAKLHQFLNVPSPRLQAKAFQALAQIYDLTYKDVQPLLLSGDIVLTTLATGWLSENIEYGNLQDLIQAYHKFSEPQDVETMTAIINVINSLKSNKSIAFLDSIYLNTSNMVIAKKAAEGLSNFDIGIHKKDFDTNMLFIPDSMIYDPGPISATIQTAKGDIIIDLWPDIAPATVSNFVYLSQKGYYKNLTFHRVVSDFVIQGGDPRGDGWGGPGYSIPCEYNEKPFIRGSIGMATSGKDTGGSQFFICHSEQPHLNGRHTNFGIVTKSLEIVDKIVKDDKIINIVITN